MILIVDYFQNYIKFWLNFCDFWFWVGIGFESSFGPTKIFFQVGLVSSKRKLFIGFRSGFRLTLSRLCGFESATRPVQDSIVVTQQQKILGNNSETSIAVYLSSQRYTVSHCSPKSDFLFKIFNRNEDALTKNILTGVQNIGKSHFF